jgi:hypothetical protein
MASFIGHTQKWDVIAELLPVYCDLNFCSMEKFKVRSQNISNNMIINALDFRLKFFWSLMSYLDEFVESLRHLESFNKGFRGQNKDFFLIKKTLSEFWKMRDEDPYTSMRVVLEHLSSTYVKGIPQESIVNKCHAISQGFWEIFQSSELAIGFSLNITIGNVIYENNNLYNLDKSRLKIIMNQGHLLSESLDAHVWLTFEDMTVVDLTIMPTLFFRGMVSEKEWLENPVVIWREDIESPLKYQPLLVDNEFMYRVDKIMNN